jgi:hypothetical protein
MNLRGLEINECNEYNFRSAIFLSQKEKWPRFAYSQSKSLDDERKKS